MENNTENFDPVSYEQIRFSKPYAVIRQKRKRRKLKAWQTVLFACCVMTFFYLGLPWILYRSGMDELGMTLAVLLPVLFMGNYRNVQERVGLNRVENRFLRWLLILAGDVLLFFFAVLVLMILDAVF